jgi:hypothetical protein
LGIVTGKLLLNDKPVNEASLFLSDVIKDTDGEERLVSIDYNTKIRASTGPDGSFTFINVPVQHFAFVLNVVTNAYVLLKPGTQEPIIVKIEPGKTVDLGTLNYDALPITP